MVSVWMGIKLHQIFTLLTNERAKIEFYQRQINKWHMAVAKWISMLWIQFLRTKNLYDFSICCWKNLSFPLFFSYCVLVRNIFYSRNDFYGFYLIAKVLSHWFHLTIVGYLCDKFCDVDYFKNDSIDENWIQKNCPIYCFFSELR